MAAKRHHHKKEHITKHDREQDRENLMHAKPHGHSKHHDPRHMNHMHHSSEHSSLYSRNMNEGDYAGEYARRTQEMEDAGMIHEDMRQIANLPQEVMMKPYPKAGPYMPEGLDDTIEGVDHQMDHDDGKRRMHNVPKKV